MAPRWRKLWRDVWLQRGRMLLMIAAITVSLMGVGTILGTHAIMSREVPRSYLSTRPASASLELREEVSPALIQAVRALPSVSAAEAGEIVAARAKVGLDWVPLLLFVVDDFDTQQLNRFARERGAWPPARGSMLVERTAVRILKADQGGRLLVKTPHGAAQTITISGLVHDAGLAPAWQERAGYGYITRETLAVLGEEAVFRELRVEFKQARNVIAIDQAVLELSAWLTARGLHVEQARVPPLAQHPHQTQMNAVMGLLLTLSGMALALSGVLVGSSISALLARQLREIGVMKTVGATTSQTIALYLALVCGLGVVAEIVALPIGALGARSLSAKVAAMLNIELVSLHIPAWVFGVQTASAIIVPLTLAAVPIQRACRMTVRAALDRQEAVEPDMGFELPRVARMFDGIDRTLALALRNALRRPVRSLLTVMLLGTGGAMFLTSLNVARGWERMTERVYEDRSYDVEVRLNQPAAVADTLRSIVGVRSVEAWGYARTAVWRPQAIDIVRTYPDGGHGSFTLLGPPPDTSLIRFPLLAGRWLQRGDTDAVVLNHMALAQLPGAAVGDTIQLSLVGEPNTWRVVGIVEEVGAASAAYVTRDALARAAKEPADAGRLLRISVDRPEQRTQLIRQIEQRLQAEGASVEAVIPLAVLRTAMGDHVLILIRLLLSMAALMIIVGLLGLASTMGNNVLERTREIGVLKTLGATPRKILGLVTTEALVLAGASFCLALIASLPLSAAIGGTVGKLAFRLGLPLVLDGAAIGVWLCAVLLFSTAAVWVPAHRAAKLTVTEALVRL
ncbi:MAG: ABC transporter permease [Myxococcota bacterium]